MYRLGGQRMCIKESVYRWDRGEMCIDESERECV